jgi:hypothetical protein
MRSRATAIVAAGAAVLAAMGIASGSAGAATIGHFKTPTHNITCDYSYGGKDTKPFVVCSIKSGLKPAPPHRDCHGAGDYTDHIIGLQATGRASEPSCAGDPGPAVFEKVARVLRYGQTWSHSGLRCTSAFEGLTCTNRKGHGFFLSRERAPRF